MFQIFTNNTRFFFFLQFIFSFLFSGIMRLFHIPTIIFRAVPCLKLEKIQSHSFEHVCASEGRWKPLPRHFSSTIIKEMKMCPLAFVTFSSSLSVYHQKRRRKVRFVTVVFFPSDSTKLHLHFRGINLLW